MSMTGRWCDSAKKQALLFLSLFRDQTHHSSNLQHNSRLGEGKIRSYKPALHKPAGSCSLCQQGCLNPANDLLDFSSFLTMKARVWHVCVSGERFQAIGESHPSFIIDGQLAGIVSTSSLIRSLEAATGQSNKAHVFFFF